MGQKILWEAEEGGGTWGKSIRLRNQDTSDPTGLLCDFLHTTYPFCESVFSNVKWKKRVFRTSENWGKDSEI